MEEDIREFSKIINDLPGLKPNSKSEIIQRFGQALIDGQITDHFPELGNGSFKLCCALDPEEKYVIKFVLSFSNAMEEVDLSNELNDTLEDRVFLPEWGFQLSKDYFPSYDYDSDDYEEDEEVPYLAFIIIQPRITFLVDDDRNNVSIYDTEYKEDDDPSPVIDHRSSRCLSTGDVLESQITSVTWLQSIVDNYGIDFCEDFLALINSYGIHDLHWENIGYIDTDGTLLPVIIDFM